MNSPRIYDDTYHLPHANIDGMSYSTTLRARGERNDMLPQRRMPINICVDPVTDHSQVIWLYDGKQWQNVAAVFHVDNLQFAIDIVLLRTQKCTCCGDRLAVYALKADTDVRLCQPCGQRASYHGIDVVNLIHMMEKVE